MMVRWRAWYADGREFSSADMCWVDLPPFGVLVVIEYRDTGRTIYTGGDWYWLYSARFGYMPSGAWGTWQAAPTFAEAPCRSCVKRGEGVSDDAFREVVAMALASPAVR